MQPPGMREYRSILKSVRIKTQEAVAWPEQPTFSKKYKLVSFGLIHVQKMYSFLPKVSDHELCAFEGI